MWRPWAVHVGFALVAGLALTLYLRLGGVPGGLVFISSGALPWVAVMWSLRGGRLPDVRPWRVTALGLGLLTVTNVEALVQMQFQHKPVADGFVYLCTYAGGYLGLLVGAVLVVAPHARHDLGGILDAAIIACTGSGLLWASVIQPSLAASDLGAAGQAYDLLLLTIVAAIAGTLLRVTVVALSARGALAYLLVAVALTLAGQVWRMLAADPVTGEYPRGIAGLWVVGFFALGAAVLHPSATQLTVATSPPSENLSGRRLAYLGLAMVAAPLTAGVHEMRGLEIDGLQLAFGSLVLAPLVMARVRQLALSQQAAERALAFHADHDELTGLPNRRRGLRHLEESLDRLGEGTIPGVLVLFCDLDGFKEVNDQRGHLAGDAVLAAVAGRLGRCVRKHDLVARLGGDEFLVVCEGDPALLAGDMDARIRQALAAPIEIGGDTVTLGVSIGVAGVTSPEPADAVIAVADQRMYEQKRRRREEPVAGPPVRRAG